MCSESAKQFHQLFDSLLALFCLVNVWNLIVNFTLFVKKLQSTRHLRYVLREFVCKMFRNYYALAAPDVP